MIVAKRVPTSVVVSEELRRAAIHGMAAAEVAASTMITRREAALMDRRMMGMGGVHEAAKELWPDLVIEETKFNQSKWGTFPRPLMTTTGYALSWYPEWRVVVYVRDW